MTTQYPIICLLVVLGVIAPVAAWPQAPDAPADWPLPRGDIYATGTSRAAGPTAPVIQWETRIRGSGSAPMVADAAGTVYLARSGAEGATIHALNLTDGSERWVLRRDRDEVVKALALVGGALYATDARGALLVVDPATGDILAQHAEIAEGGLEWLASILPLPGGGLLLSGRTQLSVIERDLSSPKWTWTDPGQEGAVISGVLLPSLTRSGEALVPASGVLYALALDDGQVQWTYDTGEFSFVMAAAVDEDNRVFWVGTIDQRVGHRRYILVCLEGNTGTLLWSQELAESVQSVPAISDGRVVLMVGAHLRYWSAADGELLRSVRLRNSGGGLYGRAGPVIDPEGRVYFIDGLNAHCYSLEDGTEIFRKEITHSLHDFVLTGDGSLVATNTIGEIYCLRDEPED